MKLRNPGLHTDTVSVRSLDHGMQYILFCIPRCDRCRLSGIEEHTGGVFIIFVLFAEQRYRIDSMGMTSLDKWADIGKLMKVLWRANDNLTMQLAFPADQTKRQDKQEIPQQMHTLPLFFPLA